ncbi:MAG: hypothetical protein AB1665_09115, partial [Candidatus Thermoplasmatota archaeon]
FWNAEGILFLTAPTDLNGTFNVSLYHGNYTFRAHKGEEWSMPQQLFVRALGNLTLNATLYPSVEVTLDATLGGARAANLSIRFEHLHQSERSMLLTTDSKGSAREWIPAGEYSIYASRLQGEKRYAYLGTMQIRRSAEIAVQLQPAGMVSGTLLDAQFQNTMIVLEGAGRYQTRSTAPGYFEALVPIGTYNLWAVSPAGISTRYVGVAQVEVEAEGAELEIPMQSGEEVSGLLYHDRNGNGIADHDEGIAGSLAVSDALGPRRVYTDAEGRFSTLATGSLSLDAQASGYNDHTLTEMSLPQPTLEISLTPSPIMISGTVSASDGASMDGGIVLAEELFGNATSSFMVRGTVYTGALSPGEYNLTFSKEGGDGEYQLSERVMGLRVELGDDPLVLDLSVKKRYAVECNVTIEGEGESANLSFKGPEEYDYRMEQPGAAVHLEPGLYAVIAQKTHNATEYMAMKQVAVLYPGNVSIALKQATILSGSAVYEAERKKGVEVRAVEQGTGIEFSAVASNDTGDFSLALPRGYLFDLAVDYIENDTSVQGRQYRYRGEAKNLSTDMDRISRTIELAREIVNVTLEMRFQGVAGGMVELLAADASGISSKGEVDERGKLVKELAPGRYVIFMVTDAREAYISELNLTEDTFIEAVVSSACKLSGNLYYKGVVPASNATITLSFLGVEKELSADPLGYFEAWLPPGGYEVSAELKVEEEGVETVYTANHPLNLTRNLRLTRELYKVETYGVEILWDSIERRHAQPGSVVNYTIVVRNKGNVEDVFALSSTADEGWTVSFPQPDLPLDPGEERDVRVSITLPEDAKVAHGAVTVKASSKLERPTASVSKVLELDVVPYYALDLFPSPGAPKLGAENLTLGITVQHLGNAKDNITITCLNAEDLARAGWRAEWVPASGWKVENASAVSDEMNPGDLKE